jgi:hypothetical protein
MSQGDENMMGQVPQIPQMQGPNGEWSIFGILVTGIAMLGAGLLFLFKSREAEHTQQIKDLKADQSELKLVFIELQKKADTCQEERVIMHGQIAAAKIEVAELKVQVMRLSNAQ